MDFNSDGLLCQGQEHSWLYMANDSPLETEVGQTQLHLSLNYFTEIQTGRSQPREKWLQTWSGT